jgi:3'-5' exoribonuclease
VGKIHELTYNRSFTYTTRGQLLGHMIIELEMLQAKLAVVPNFPPELKTLLEHLIISHHGEYEFGSPKLPMFPEALLLHYMDDLDSKMESMRALFERDLDPDNPWTTYSPSLGRPLLNTAKFLTPKDAPVLEPEAGSQTETLPLSDLGLPDEAEPTPVATDTGSKN